MLGDQRGERPTTRSGAGVSPSAAARVQDRTEIPSHSHKVRVVKQAASSVIWPGFASSDATAGAGFGAGPWDNWPHIAREVMILVPNACSFRASEAARDSPPWRFLFRVRVPSTVPHEGGSLGWRGGGYRAAGFRRLGLARVMSIVPGLYCQAQQGPQSPLFSRDASQPIMNNRQGREKSRIVDHVHDSRAIGHHGSHANEVQGGVSDILRDVVATSCLCGCLQQADVFSRVILPFPGSQSILNGDSRSSSVLRVRLISVPVLERVGLL